MGTTASARPAAEAISTCFPPRAVPPAEPGRRSAGTDRRTSQLDVRDNDGQIAVAARDARRAARAREIFESRRQARRRVEEIDDDARLALDHELELDAPRSSPRCDGSRSQGLEAGEGHDAGAREALRPALAAAAHRAQPPAV